MSSALQKFEAIFPKLVADLSQHAQQFGLPENALKWYEDVSSRPRVFLDIHFDRSFFLAEFVCPSPLNSTPWVENAIAACR